MPKGKGAKGTKVTVKIAKKAIRMTPDGRRRLTLSNMGITVFPKCLLKLTNVDELDLSRNLIQKLPENIGNFSSLRWLDLHSNKLESVPESIGNLVGLTHLNLSNNRLTSAALPSTLGLLTNLKSLNLGMNQLDDLPPTMVALDSLQELGLFDNLFISLPEFVKVLRSLTKLNVKRNPLLYVQGDGEGTLKEKPEEDVYLVHESSLCRTCLKRCKEQTERLTRGGGGGGGGDAFEEKRIRTYSGLMAPNSVATVNQDVWRIKKLEHKPIK
ncbi:leucine-rich repeat-containing protein 18 [Thunnus albacares]|uniref:leucine-rich repeat-containing protein 18 n=1 Tax=Thunnus albacares TaxID=8236 RepID=UPI001CF645FB|nr:leucine-rich repeat-containing protein 18 [Thunnus albacares]XP_044228585.1 leucine-rich repeat-containing protein 18 [Thunnus albacares]XP_044228586.1 leucine-rich repeat-containing protein 18 [Thunnus albacares]XP_044228587.1 leucine-rich repeat-containing protein 18 [Thunnus albacares]XP_044228588.1 leucine-rich repeat-containing protein 18 [Thunnus albacares]XP_044228589.1 leucine-rich repeat-containing protein 18 [Thunnus albacares]XP_044228590.1 leucine-rich repeat-containing protein